MATLPSFEVRFPLEEKSFENRVETSLSLLFSQTIAVLNLSKMGLRNLRKLT